MSRRIAVLGASGFVGSALCERLFFEGSDEFVAVIHGSGRAGRIARLGIELRVADLMKPDSIRKAIQGCEVVVNCAMGDHDAMTRGFRNLVRALRDVRPSKFIHLSSILIYGETPPAASVDEDAEPDPGRNEYGQTKLAQDRLVLGLHRGGVPSYILCPGNITGPYSPFLRSLCERLVQGPLPLVDGGRYPSNLIHVDNLVEGILAAIRSGRGAGARYFVNETRPVPWRELLEDLCVRMDVAPTFVEVTREAVLDRINAPQRRAGLREHLRVAASDEFRRSMNRLPVVAAANRLALGVFRRLSIENQESLRRRLRWPVQLEKRGTSAPLDERFVKVQIRQHFHSPARLAQTLGWRPPLTYEEGLDVTTAWMRFAGVAPMGGRGGRDLA
ncbi:MAG TPA: NAD(P)-dependent oxidoreductase [Candidatus Polarisedimenticolaceae bacterium]